MTRPKIIVHNHFATPARDYAPTEVQAKLKKLKDALAKGELSQKQYDKLEKELLDQLPWAKDNYYHAGQVNGYYILEGAVGDKGHWLVRNGSYDIVKTASSKAEAVSFAKSQKPGGAMAQAADAEKKQVKTVKRHDGTAKIYELGTGEFEVVFPDGDNGKYPSLASATQQAKT